MNNRAYILLDILDGKVEQVIRGLQGKPCMVIADWLDGRSDTVLVIGASDRQRLAEFVMPILAFNRQRNRGAPVTCDPRQCSIQYCLWSSDSK